MLEKIDRRLYRLIAGYLRPVEHEFGALLNLNRWRRAALRGAAEAAGERWWGSRKMARQICYSPETMLRNANPRDMWWAVAQLHRLGKSVYVDWVAMPIVVWRHDHEAIWDVDMHFMSWFGIHEIVCRYVPMWYLDALCRKMKQHRCAHWLSAVLASHPRCNTDDI